MNASRRRDFESGGDECHMAFHFPVMPRIFMAVRRESRYPISDILAETPPIPSGCQWGIFLRNHDELTLEMVTDEERDVAKSLVAFINDLGGGNAEPLCGGKGVTF